MQANSIKEGDYVVLDINGDRFPLVKVTKGGQAKVAKNYVSIDPLLGSKFGSTWNVTAEKLPRLIQAEPQAVWDDTTATARNNAELVDDGSAQQLTQEDIARLRAEGKAGSEIIEVLKQSSATFANKTEFSQEKYIRKKQKKYMTKVVVRRPTARVLCEAYLVNDPKRIHWMRIDTLSQMLHMGNAGAYGRVLVVDYCAGLVAGAVAERMGGMGLMVMAHGESHPPPHDIVHRFNFDRKHYDTLRTCSLKRLLGDAPVAEAAAAPKGEAEGAGADATEAEEPPAAAAEEGAGAAGPGPSSEAAQQGRKRSRNQMESANSNPDKVSQRINTLSDAELTVLKQQGFTSLIVAWPQASYATLLPALLPLLAPSAPFVAYHNSMQPLVTAFDALFANKSSVNVQLSESWMRVHQVLPMRTHPNMSMSGTGGFLISGTRVDPNYAPPAVAPAANAGAAAQ